MERIIDHFQSVYGIGKITALKLCYVVNVSPFKERRFVSNQKLTEATSYLKNKKYICGFNLENKKLDSFVYNDNIGSIKSFKLKNNLPINGQRSKTNGRTAKKFTALVNRLLKKTK
jgi:ribosomal protein S13